MGGCKANLEFNARLKFGECIKKRGGAEGVGGGMEFSTSAQTKNDTDVNTGAPLAQRSGQTGAP